MGCLSPTSLILNPRPRACRGSTSGSQILEVQRPARLQRKGEGRKTSSGEKNHDIGSDSNSASVFGEPPLRQQRARRFACLITRGPRGGKSPILKMRQLRSERVRDTSEVTQPVVLGSRYVGL